MKKYLSIFISIVMFITMSFVCFTAQAEELIAINETNFPDASWRTIVSAMYDTDEDGYLSESEISVVTRISVSGLALDIFDDDVTITSIKGIEFFKNLSSLNCGGLNITSLDVSANTELTDLTCQGNELETLDVSANTNLTTLICNANFLTSLNVSSNTKLVKLHCYANDLTSLDISNLTLLEDLNCHSNELSSLVLSSNTALSNLHCSYNHLSQLDLKANTALTSVTGPMIGNQTLTGTASYSDGLFSTYLYIEDSLCVTGVNVDYDGLYFTTDNYDDVLNGFVYNYNVGINSAEDMDVTISLSKDFYRVRYYTDENATIVSTQIVSNGGSATQPSIDNPYGKYFDHWDTDSSNVTSDLDIYPVWELAKTITGTVTEMANENDETGTLGTIEGATITCDGVAVATTDANGAYSFLVPNGTTTITVSTNSSIDRTVSFVVNDNDISGATIPIVNCDYLKDGVFNARDIAKSNSSAKTIENFMIGFQYSELTY